MISKQKLWFLTLFSVIFALGVYYITMPNDLLKDVISTETNEKVEDTVKEISSLVAMRVSLEEERQGSIDALQEQLVSNELGTEEKNNIYEMLKYLNEIQGREEEFEKKIREQYNVNCFVKIENSDVSIVCVSDKHDNVLANNIMRLVQNEYDNKLFITVKFQKQ